MDPCRKWRRFIVMKAVGEISPQEMVSLMRHLQQCLSCREHEWKLLRIIELIREALCPSNTPLLLSRKGLKENFWRCL